MAITLSNSTPIKISLEMLMGLLVVVATVSIQYFLITSQIKEVQTDIVRQDKRIVSIEATAARLNEVQLLQQLSASARMGDRWTGDMQKYFYSRLLRVLQDLHPDKDVAKLMQDADPYVIQQRYPTSGTATPDKQ